jgi:hypothetical protein
MRVLLAAVVVLAALTPLALWLRSSALVRVERVTVTGIAGTQADEIRAALTAAARDMTVLDVRHDALRGAVGSYPIVRSLRTETDFPHGLTIAVNAHEPVGAIEAAGRRTAVAADGTLLRGSATDRLPTVGVRADAGWPARRRRADARRDRGAGRRPAGPARARDARVPRPARPRGHDGRRSQARLRRAGARRREVGGCRAGPRGQHLARCALRRPEDPGAARRRRSAAANRRGSGSTLG